MITKSVFYHTTFRELNFASKNCGNILGEQSELYALNELLMCEDGNFLDRFISTQPIRPQLILVSAALSD